ncbi:hypothetical protein BJV38_002244 [Clostridium beijerinckii]|uniref:hypothetical protein n=1 Tax=Clostridium beijerinckii TaxID=1520 RepID=UPI0009CE2150|nr:hypothetical protein [Clostridium beijerinckii]MBA8934726.1 hypothetical protein [Clostridium beijerinckii]NRT35169.1 hypothetical protein [Clostridium beijerinckii]NRT45401.1 hypothetical protein [Clostridium beijerinckii]NRZ20602.1 hypothetical protein [Clostridium beijerinckii]OOM60724.1 hypothetical protein CLBEIC_56540 [Clostridium beijerinckii]
MDKIYESKENRLYRKSKGEIFFTRELRFNITHQREYMFENDFIDFIEGIEKIFEPKYDIEGYKLILSKI